MRCRGRDADAVRAQSFMDMVDFLTRKEKWSLQHMLDFKKEMAAKGGATGWKSKIPFLGSGKEDREALVKSIKLLEQVAC